MTTKTKEKINGKAEVEQPDVVQLTDIEKEKVMNAIQARVQAQRDYDLAQLREMDIMDLILSAHGYDPSKVKNAQVTPNKELLVYG